jgi:hypothetical protein
MSTERKRGPNKQYMYDPCFKKPSSTQFDRRKRLKAIRLSTPIVSKQTNKSVPCLVILIDQVNQFDTMELRHTKIKICNTTCNKTFQSGQMIQQQRTSTNYSFYIRLKFVYFPTSWPDFM